MNRAAQIFNNSRRQAKNVLQILQDSPAAYTQAHSPSLLSTAMPDLFIARGQYVLFPLCENTSILHIGLRHKFPNLGYSS
jgi:hypothetical protein